MDAVDVERLFFGGLKRSMKKVLVCLPPAVVQDRTISPSYPPAPLPLKPQPYNTAALTCVLNPSINTPIYFKMLTIQPALICFNSTVFTLKPPSIFIKTATPYMLFANVE